MRILIKLPTRSRPVKALAILKEYLELLADPTRVDWLVNIDEDDSTMNTDDMKENVLSLLPPGRAEVHVARNTSKIEACNAGMEDRPFDILLLASDDMHPRVKGYDTVIRDAMEQHYPDLDGVLFFNDGHRGSNLNTLCILGRTYYNRFGYIYHPSYRSFYCDNEFTEEADRLGRQTYIDQTIIEHVHPDHGFVCMDASYVLNRRWLYLDQCTYYHRKPYAVDLSILMCTLHQRRGIRTRIERNLRSQIASALPFVVDLCISEDNGEMTIGEKRNLLVRQAKGRFACIVDDDDNVSPDYIQIIRRALEQVTDADVVQMRGAYYVDDCFDRPFFHSLTHQTYWEDAHGFYRPPNHLNVTRTYIMQTIPSKPAASGRTRIML